jgi:hypothetical protein
MSNMAVDAVMCELFSAGNSQLTGKNSGNFAPSIERYEKETRESSCLASYLGSSTPIPNRDLAGAMQGFPFPATYWVRCRSKM